MPDWLNVYHRLPYILKVSAASARGFQLQRLRYGKETASLVQQALDRESWSFEQWQIWQDERLAYMLHHAAANVPYYREYWQNQRRVGNRLSTELLNNWPILSKDILRQQPQQFLADHVNPHSQIIEHTSGTSGTPLTLWMSKAAVRQWYAFFEARWRRWYGLSQNDRWGILGGQLVTSYSQDHPPFWVWNAGLQQLYLSSYHLAPLYIPDYLHAIRRYQLVYLLGYASSLTSLAQFALEQKLELPSLKAIISNAEPLYTHQRDLISQAFQCPVYDTYGLSEIVCAASECLSGQMHLWPEVGFTEVLDDLEDSPVPIGRSGRIVCTGFLNLAMPLIRYDVGDRGFLSADTNCSCGRHMTILGGIEGRNDDVLFTRDGRRIGRLDPVFKAGLHIREAQIIQDRLDHVTVRYVPAPGCFNGDMDYLIKQLKEYLGDMTIVLEPVGRIPRSANGKFKAVISNIPK